MARRITKTQVEVENGEGEEGLAHKVRSGRFSKLNKEENTTITDLGTITSCRVFFIQY